MLCRFIGLGRLCMLVVLGVAIQGYAASLVRPPDFSVVAEDTTPDPPTILNVTMGRFILTNNTTNFKIRALEIELENVYEASTTLEGWGATLSDYETIPGSGSGGGAISGLICAPPDTEPEPGQVECFEYVLYQQGPGRVDPELDLGFGTFGSRDEFTFAFVNPASNALLSTALADGIQGRFGVLVVDRQGNTQTCVGVLGATGCSLTVDDDNDGVPDGTDACLDTPANEVVNAQGCAIVDLCPCEATWKNHGAYVSCVSHAAESFVASGDLTEAEKDAVVSPAGAAECGKQ